jgi:hypothetical protein
MTVGAENLRSHGTPVGAHAVEIEHRIQQARLRQSAAANMHHRMTRLCAGVHLQDYVQWIGRGSRRQVTIHRVDGLPGTIPVATETIFVLIAGRIDHRRTIHPNADRAPLGNADQWRDVEGSDLFGAMGVVTVGAGSMAIVVQHGVFGGVMIICTGWERVPDLAEFRRNI